jgi:hypothetical protein
VAEAQPAGRAGWTPPEGTQRRIRSRAIWAVALFAASVPPAFVAVGVANIGSDEADVVLPLTFGFWTIGLFFAFWAAFPTLRYWEALPVHVRWMGALPWLTVSFFACAVMITSLLV